MNAVKNLPLKNKKSINHKLKDRGKCMLQMLKTYKIAAKKELILICGWS